MLNKRRLTGLGWVWLVTLYVISVVMVALIALSVVGYVTTPRQLAGVRGSNDLQLLGAALAALVQVWAHVAVVLGVLIWTECDRMLPSEKQAWDDAQRRR